VNHYYAEHTVELRNALGRELPIDVLRELHSKRPVLHGLVAAGLVSSLALSTWAIVALDRWYLWGPFAVVSGFAIFNFTVLLHEVVHRAVAQDISKRSNRFIEMLYAIPSGISATQFTRWHLDHHAGLGSEEEDPKRHYLSPKRNARWFKLLYFTPALFPIYFRAARKEAASYPDSLRRTIDRERNLTILTHLALLAAVVYFFGWAIAWKAYLVPYFFIFPIAFALNRLGQHYDIDPADPAKWSTLVKGSWFWDIVFLCSNYHIEHHYFPGVPLYNLPRLQQLLMPFYEKRGFVARSYGELLWRYLVLNRKPHTNWSGAPAPSGERLPVASGR
jgi:fatty acid desaturase